MTRDRSPCLPENILMGGDRDSSLFTLHSFPPGGRYIIKKGEANFSIENMSVKLSGSLNYFPLIEILDLLVSEKETGNLSIELKDEKGGVFLEKGKIVHAYYKNLFQGKEAFFKLFTIEEGNFT